MSTDKLKLKTVTSIFPECNDKMVSVIFSIDEYSRTFEMMTGRQLGDPMPEHISDNVIRELNLITNRIESSIISLNKCIANNADTKNK